MKLNIAAWEKTAEKFGISMTEVVVVVHDNAADVFALRMLEEGHRVIHYS